MKEEMRLTLNNSSPSYSEDIEEAVLKIAKEVKIDTKKESTDIYYRKFPHQTSIWHKSQQMKFKPSDFKQPKTVCNPFINSAMNVTSPPLKAYNYI